MDLSRSNMTESAELKYELRAGSECWSSFFTTKWPWMSFFTSLSQLHPLKNGSKDVFP